MLEGLIVFANGMSMIPRARFVRPLRVLVIGDPDDRRERAAGHDAEVERAEVGLRQIGGPFARLSQLGDRAVQIDRDELVVVVDADHGRPERNGRRRRALCRNRNGVQVSRPGHPGHRDRRRRARGGDAPPAGSDRIGGGEEAADRHRRDFPRVPDAEGADDVAVARIREKEVRVAGRVELLPGDFEHCGQLFVGSRLRRDVVEDPVLEVDVHVGRETHHDPDRWGLRGRLLELRGELRARARSRPRDLGVGDTGLEAAGHRRRRLGQRGIRSVDAIEIEPAGVHPKAARSADDAIAAAECHAREVDLAGPERGRIRIHETSRSVLISRNGDRRSDERIARYRLGGAERAAGDRRGDVARRVLDERHAVRAEHVPLGGNPVTGRWVALSAVRLQLDGPRPERRIEVLLRDPLRGQEGPVERRVHAVVRRELLPVIVVERTRIPLHVALKVDAGE